MTPGARVVVSRAALVLGAILLGVLAWRVGGGADAALPPPSSVGAASTARAGSASDAAAPPAGGAAEYEVATRLVELAGHARIEAPNVALTQKVLKAHWRKMRPAWFEATGAAATARAVTTIALRTSAIETQSLMPSNTAGEAWRPDAKVWNMNEGSFDQRDALVAAAPASFAFEVAVPQGGRLTFSEGTVNATRDTTVFVVTVKPANGPAREVYRHRLGAAGARRWTDATCDLDAFAGQTIELRLSTESAPSTREERVAADRRREAVRLAELDAGAPDSGAAADTTSAAAATGTQADDADADAGAQKDAANEALLATPGPAVALWGSPTILARTTPRLPYNVVWIVVDALRADVIASFHDDADDAVKQSAPLPPLEALLPKVPGLTPAIDALAKKGVRFTRAYSAATWTRPGTVAMLAGARSSELGLDTQRWVLREPVTSSFYASEPALLPLVARRHGASSQAFVNNYFMLGYAPVGVDLGFEHVVDHRYRTRDTLEVTRDATAWIRAHHDTRFFLFVNYNSPHEPYEPPPTFLERIPPPPRGPADKTARLYMAEAAKDDEAIGVLVQSLTDVGLRERTIIVVTADHGETMSSAHAGTSALDHVAVRYHHASSNYEETAHVPILVVAPGLLPADRAVSERVSTTDLAPTIVELLGLEPHPRASGKSLVALAKGQKEKDERVIVTEGRSTRAVMHGRHRLLVREGAARTTMYADHTVTVNEELYDLVDDPGERHDLAAARPDLVAEMRARLDAALANVPVAGSAAALAGEGDGARPPVIRLRFAGGGAARRVSGTITAGDAKTTARSFTIEPVDLGRDALTVTGEHGERASIAFATNPSSTVGFDIVVDPPAAPVTWDLYLDDRPWPDDAVFGGPYGLLAPSLRRGMASDEARSIALTGALPQIDPRRESGVFVVRSRGEERDRDRDRARDPEREGERDEETKRLLREWGYAK